MASAGAPAGVQGQSPRWGSGGFVPEADEAFVFKAVIFNALHLLQICMK